MLAKPLTDMTAARKPMTLNWGENEQFAFDDLRQKICQAPVLAVPQPGKPFTFQALYRYFSYRRRLSVALM